MLTTTSLYITDHARERYRQRVDPDANHKDIVKAVRQATMPTAKNYRRLRQQYANKKSLGVFHDTIFLVERLTVREHVIFVLQSPKAGVFLLITCWKTDTLTGN